MELSEISLDLNLIDNAIRYKFTDAPILSISIEESNDNIVILVATVSSLHHLKFAHPKEFSKGQDDMQSYSVFHGASTGQSTRDSNASRFYVINPISASSKFKHSCSSFYALETYYFPVSEIQINQFHMLHRAHSAKVDMKLTLRLPIKQMSSYIR